MSERILRKLEEALSRGNVHLGQVTVSCRPGLFELCHSEDVGIEQVEVSTAAASALSIARYNEAGDYRPLKSAPDLRRGWRLCLQTLAEAVEALDYLYPAMLGCWAAYERHELEPVHLRVTLGRQTGMYRVTGKLTNVQADAVMAKTCNSVSCCLKIILWQIDEKTSCRSLPPAEFDPSVGARADTGTRIPLLCAEACNVLIEQARRTVKETGSEG